MAVRERLHADQERISLAGGGMIDRDAWREDKANLERLGERLQERLQDIAQLGGTRRIWASGSWISRICETGGS